MQYLRYHLRRDDLSPFDILDASSPRFFWAEPGSEDAWAGTGAEARLTGSGAGKFQQIKRDAAEVLSQVVDLNPAPVPNRLFGGFSFTPTLDSVDWSGFTAAEFILPRLQVTRLDGETWLTICRRAGAGVTLETLAAEARAVRPVDVSAPAGLSHLCDATSYDEWAAMVTGGVHEIRNEKMCKVVLARARAAQFDGALNPLHPLVTLNQNYPNTFRFLFAPYGQKTFLGATPELLARVERGELFSVALAGSVGRGKTPAEAEALAAELLSSTKDRHEHALVVGAIRHGLEPLTAQLDIPNVPGIRRLANIQHLETPIRGRLAAGYGALDVVAALHPTPALGGVPRQPALEFIAANEPTARGWYAAPIGWLDANGDGTFAVAIRSALLEGDRALLYAGAGIVDGSDPAKEWQETELKFKPLMDALTGSPVAQYARTMSLAHV